MEKNSPLKLPLLAAAAPGAIKGLAGIAGGIIGSRKRKREERAAQREYDKYKAQLENRDTSNPYANMENTMEDLTVNTQAADMANQQQQQALANTMDSMQGAAGGSGVAALAQAMAGQASRNAQSASADIARQEQANQIAERNMAAQLQSQERQGDLMSRQMEQQKTNTLLGMAQGRLGAAKAARQQATQAIVGGIGQVAGSFASAHAGDMANIGAIEK
tara:strand:+ start:14365 stop:15021 length:657 start_codon:yes stop_codon:yes gene_type:complete